MVFDWLYLCVKQVVKTEALDMIVEGARKARNILAADMEMVQR